MARSKDYVSVIVEEYEKISEFIGQISSDMYEYVSEAKDSRFVMFYKYLTHSDLATFGKATKVDSHDDNLLYYLKTEDMLKIEENTKKPFQTAHQSCIGLTDSFYTKVGLRNPREGEPYLINEFIISSINESSLVILFFIV